MVAKKGKKSTRGMKDLPAKKLNAKQAKDVKGGISWSGSTGDDRKVGKFKVI
jgi:hypothetical protein